jgi:hypothetical protein
MLFTYHQQPLYSRCRNTYLKKEKQYFRKILDSMARDEISGKCRMYLTAVSVYNLKKRGYLKDFKYSYENKIQMELEGITRHVGDKTNLSQKWE